MHSVSCHVPLTTERAGRAREMKGVPPDGNVVPRRCGKNARKKAMTFSSRALEKKRNPELCAPPPRVPEGTEDDARTRFIVSSGSPADNIDFIHLCGKCIRLAK